MKFTAAWPRDRLPMRRPKRCFLAVRVMASDSVIRHPLLSFPSRVSVSAIDIVGLRHCRAVCHYI